MNGKRHDPTAQGAQSTTSRGNPPPMTLADVTDLLDAEVIAGEHRLSTPVAMGCGADLMSDVLTYAKPGSLLLTGLTNTQVVRTAEIADIVAICFVRGKRPGVDTVRLADSQELPLLRTTLPMFESCGRLYNHGLQGVSESKG